ncbi:hypothetical protein LMA02_22705 [Burkholderia sp. B21-005]|nr:hypothetical protein LMA01_22075 [Burkholderia sp. B21-007]UEP45759.1 hypothetical protein LMA02_22705 [Burkholderia sp. B21-005]
MDGSWVGIVVGTFVLALAAMAVASHYRREHRRAELLRNLDHHDWCRWTHAHRADSRAVKR